LIIVNRNKRWKKKHQYRYTHCVCGLLLSENLLLPIARQQGEIDPSGRPRLASVKRRHKRQQAQPRRLHLARPGAPSQVPLAVAGKGQELHRLAVGHRGHPASEEGAVARKPALALEKGASLCVCVTCARDGDRGDKQTSSITQKYNTRIAKELQVKTFSAQGRHHTASHAHSFTRLAPP
jgi:hypothetical protein